MSKRVIIALAIVVVVAAGVVFFWVRSADSANKDKGPKTVDVTRGTIVDKALAIGKIEPRRQVQVKSKISGLVKKIYVNVGDVVSIGDPLFDIGPDPTPLEFADAKRGVELAQVTFDNAKKDFDRKITLNEKQLISNQEYETAKERYDEAKLRLKTAEERLSLIETGRTEVANIKVESIIRSNANGTILSIAVEQGDPVVPLTTFQAGTELMTIARMDELIFKGNVDEIDVGKIGLSMPAEIEIGALPENKVEGIVTKISPRAHTEQGSTLFELEIDVTNTGGKFLRAGYSANATIIINKRDSVFVVPERLVTITDTLSTVEIMDSLGVIANRTVKTGLSDGLNIEITEGVALGEKVVERPPRQISGQTN